MRALWTKPNVNGVMAVEFTVKIFDDFEILFLGHVRVGEILATGKLRKVFWQARDEGLILPFTIDEKALVHDSRSQSVSHPASL